MIPAFPALVVALALLLYVGGFVSVGSARLRHGITLATAALIQQFGELTMGRSDLLNPTDVHFKIMVVKIGELIPSHPEFLPAPGRRGPASPARCHPLTPNMTENAHQPKSFRFDAVPI